MLSAALFQDIRKNTSVEISDGETAQVGKAKVRGLELGFSGSITPKWNVYGGYTFLDSDLLDGAFDIGTVGQDLPHTPPTAFTLCTPSNMLPPLPVCGGPSHVAQC